MTFLNIPEDLDWLFEVHLSDVPRPAGIAVAVLIGNEDCPEQIHLYAVDDFRCVPTEYVRTDGGYVYARGPCPEQ